MTINEIIRGLSGAKRRFKDTGEVYEGFFFQQEWEALDEAIMRLVELENQITQCTKEELT